MDLTFMRDCDLVELQDTSILTALPRYALLIDEPGLFEELAKIYAFRVSNNMCTSGIYALPESGKPVNVLAGYFQNSLPLTSHGWFLNTAGTVFPVREYAFIITVLTQYRPKNAEMIEALKMPQNIFELEDEMCRALHLILTVAYAHGPVYCELVVMIIDHLLATRCMARASSEVVNGVFRACARVSALNVPSLLPFNEMTQTLDAIYQQKPAIAPYKHYIEQWRVNSAQYVDVKHHRPIVSGLGVVAKPPSADEIPKNIRAAIRKNRKIARTSVLDANASGLQKYLENKPVENVQLGDVFYNPRSLLRAEIILALALETYGTLANPAGENIKKIVKLTRLADDKPAIKTARDVLTVALSRYNFLTAASGEQIDLETFIRTSLWSTSRRSTPAEFIDKQLKIVLDILNSVQ